MKFHITSPSDSLVRIVKPRVQMENLVDSFVFTQAANVNFLFFFYGTTA